MILVRGCGPRPAGEVAVGARSAGDCSGTATPVVAGYLRFGDGHPSPSPNRKCLVLGQVKGGHMFVFGSVGG